MVMHVQCWLVGGLKKNRDAYPMMHQTSVMTALRLIPVWWRHSDRGKWRSCQNERKCAITWLIHSVLVFLTSMELTRTWCVFNRAKHWNVVTASPQASPWKKRRKGIWQIRRRPRPTRHQSRQMWRSRANRIHHAFDSRAQWRHRLPFSSQYRLKIWCDVTVTSCWSLAEIGESWKAVLE